MLKKETGYWGRMKHNQKIKEPMFNFGEKTPAYLAGVLIAMFVFTTMLLPKSLDNFFGLYSILRPLTTAGTGGLSHIVSLIGHGFLHGSWSHVLMNSGMIIVFGIATIRGVKMKSQSFKKVQAIREKKVNPNLLFLSIFLGGVIVGGIFQWGWWSLSNTLTAVAIGASGGASALFATTGWAIGGRDKMVQFGLGWGVINVVMVAAEPILGVSLAWAAHIGGYVGGMIFAPLWVQPNSTKLALH